MEKITILHNPRCSKSRTALKLLEDKGIKPDVVKYLDNPLSVDDIKELLKKIDIKPRELMRTKESIYKELGLKEINDDAKLIEAMSANPKLIERPIVVKGDQAVIGRPIENVERLIG